MIAPLHIWHNFNDKIGSKLSSSIIFKGAFAFRNQFKELLIKITFLALYCDLDSV